MTRRSTWRRRGAVAAAAALIGPTIAAGPASAAATPVLKRYPYLTDVTTSSAAVNWGTDRASINGKLTWGQAPGCNSGSSTSTKTAITVNSVSEYQWTAKATGLSANATYCYRVRAGTTGQTDLLGQDASPTLKTLPTSTSSYTYAVMGDWGQTYADGNPNQDALLSQVKASGAKFIVFTGDTGYPAGSQNNYGDLFTTGAGKSAVFAPNFWGKVGATMPAYATVGNHAPNSTFLTNWPETTVAAASGGMWAMENYPAVNGGTAKSYPSAWAAYNVGSDRYYMLEATWDDNNLGRGTAYGDDYAAHWTQNSAEYKWLKADLAAHPGGNKFAFFHYPLYTDQSTEQSDTYLQGTAGLEGLLAQNQVDVAFSGHAHVYERNLKTSPNSLVSYVTGGGGATLQSMGGSGCTDAFDAYALGWKSTTNVGSDCGAAPTPTSISKVYHFLLVTVNGSQVTVRPTDANGTVFDAKTYDFSADGAGKPTAPGGLAVTRNGPKADLSWTAATDDVGVNAYEIARDGSVIATVASYKNAYSDPAAPSGGARYTVTSIDGNGNRTGASVSLAGGQAPKTVTVYPSADTYALAGSTAKYGTASTLYAVGGSAAKTGYLRFPLDQLTDCSLVSAKLGLYVTDAASTGGTLNPVADDTWTEAGLDATNAPAVSASPSAALGKTTLATTAAADVTSFINAGSANLDLAVSSTSTDRAAYSAREVSTVAQRPQLTVTCTPTAAP